MAVHPPLAACASGLAPSRSRASRDSPSASKRRANSLQPLPADAKSASLISTDVVCAFLRSNLISSSRQALGWALLAAKATATAASIATSSNHEYGEGVRFLVITALL